MNELLIPIVSGLIGVYVGSRLTARHQTKENKKAAALRLLEGVQEKLGRWRHCAETDLRNAVLHHYRTDGSTLSADASAYLDYLGAMDFLLYAADKEMVDLSDVQPWLRGLLTWDIAGRTFIEDLRAVCGDNSALEYLLSHVDRTLAQGE